MTGLLDEIKNDGGREQVVLDQGHSGGQVFQAFGLTTPTTVDHAGDLFEMDFEYFPNNRGKCSGRA